MDFGLPAKEFDALPNQVLTARAIRSSFAHSGKCTVRFVRGWIRPAVQKRNVSFESTCKAQHRRVQ